MSFAFQTQYPIQPVQGQPGILARVQEDFFIDSSYLSNQALQPGQGVILDTMPGYVKLATSLTTSTALQLFGMVVMNPGSISNIATGPFVPPNSNYSGAVSYPAGSPLLIATTGFFFALLGGTVNKDQNAAFDPVNNYWVASPNAAGTSGGLMAATFDQSGVAGDIVIVRLSGRVS